MKQSLILNEDKNWPDGQYLCKCSYCDAAFQGHKHQHTCRSCSPLHKLIQTYIGPIGAHEGDDYPESMNQHDIETAADAILMLNNSTRATWQEILDALTGPVFNDREAKEIRDYLK